MLTPSQVARLNADMVQALAEMPAGRPANASTAPLPNGLNPAVFS